MLTTPRLSTVTARTGVAICKRMCSSAAERASNYQFDYGENPELPRQHKKGAGVIGVDYMQPKFGIVARMRPIKVQLEAGKTYKWCACGLSANQPWCDNSHEQPGATELRPIEFKAEKNMSVTLCACKQTVNRPYCDGMHKNLTAHGRLNMPVLNLISTGPDCRKHVIKGTAAKLGLRENSGWFTSID